MTTKGEQQDPNMALIKSHNYNPTEYDDYMTAISYESRLHSKAITQSMILNIMWNLITLILGALSITIDNEYQNKCIHSSEYIWNEDTATTINAVSIVICSVSFASIMIGCMLLLCTNCIKLLCTTPCLNLFFVRTIYIGLFIVNIGCMSYLFIITIWSGIKFPNDDLDCSEIIQVVMSVMLIIICPIFILTLCIIYMVNAYRDEKKVQFLGHANSRNGSINFDYYDYYYGNGYGHGHHGHNDTCCHGDDCCKCCECDCNCDCIRCSECRIDCITCDCNMEGCDICHRVICCEICNGTDCNGCDNCCDGCCNVCGNLDCNGCDNCCHGCDNCDCHGCDNCNCDCDCHGCDNCDCDCGGCGDCGDCRCIIM